MTLLLLFTSLVFFIIIRMPVAMSMLLSSFLYLLVDGRFSYTIMAERVASAMDSFPFLAIPFFILAAEIMNTGGISDRIFNFAQAFVGHIQGGLGQVNVVASIIFSGMSGSSAADAAGLGAIEIKAMLKEGYDPGFSAAITAASSTIGPIFPPASRWCSTGSWPRSPRDTCLPRGWRLAYCSASASWSPWRLWRERA